eukprot:NODE_5065_length_533_cov_458.053719_g3734_i0.p1 GENE.NODE_5065_length_533_cov_458.053719_g3734_i0~~NODE_5065_length_533_cov_458.053719_g3734_i0.p1  ORF type:complete len:87 (-),score=8.81 NODE_5065_length_533_cov_458.053719_g3734_i0:112-372(-)
MLEKRGRPASPAEGDRKTDDLRGQAVSPAAQKRGRGEGKKGAKEQEEEKGSKGVGGLKEKRGEEQLDGALNAPPPALSQSERGRVG